MDDRSNGQFILTGKREVALVMRRHSHDRARAIGHQDIIRDPDGDAHLVDRVDSIGTRENT